MGVWHANDEEGRNFGEKYLIRRKHVVLEARICWQRQAGRKMRVGVYLGMNEESSQLYIGAKDGVIKVRTSARRGEEYRWRKKEIEEMIGVPWEPILWQRSEGSQVESTHCSSRSGRGHH